MLNKPDARHEKNRHQLVTGIVVVLAIPFLLLLYFALPTRGWIAVASAIFIAAILAGRTVMIELGVRRRRSVRKEKRKG
jgi:membrane protein YdbS with pleckstrin-like domain